MACRPYNTGRCLLLRLFNPSKLWGSLHSCGTLLEDNFEIGKNVTKFAASSKSDANATSKSQEELHRHFANSRDQPGSLMV